MKFKKNQFQPLQELEMPDFRRQMGPNPYPQMGQMYQHQGQRPFTQMGGQRIVSATRSPADPAAARQASRSLQCLQDSSLHRASQASPPLEQSYIENILRLNRGKVATVYMTFENNPEWNAKVFRGEIEATGRDHIILSDRKTGTRYLSLMVYLDYITFDEPITYDYPYSMASYTPR
nr:spore coat protein GerQ [Bacillus licheniformis]